MTQPSKDEAAAPRLVAVVEDEPVLSIGDDGDIADIQEPDGGMGVRLYNCQAAGELAEGQRLRVTVEIVDARRPGRREPPHVQ